jgi:hypothetical protein
MEWTLARHLRSPLLVALSSFSLSGLCVSQVLVGQNCDVPLSTLQVSNPASSVPSTLELAVHLGKLNTSAQAPMDQGSRRMVVVLDGSKYVTDELWKLEASLASALFEQARSEDSFALYVISDQPVILDFSTSRDALRKQVNELLAGRPAHQKERRRLYDAFLAASDLFGTPHFADAIFCLAGGVDHDSSRSRDATARTLLGRGIRLFGVLFKGLDFDVPLVYVPPNISAVNVMDLAQQSGGLLEYEHTETAQHEYKFTTGSLKSAWGKVAVSYWRAVNVYRLDLSAFPASWPADLRLTLPTPNSAGAGEPEILYPHQKWTCTSRSS